MGKGSDGLLHRFVPSSEEKNYIVAVDASAGNEDSNLAAIQVVCIQDHEQVARLSGIIQPDHLAVKAQKIAEMYGNALLAVEREKYGIIVISRLMVSYPNLYYHTMKSTGWKPRIETEFGWNPRNREEAVRRMMVDFNNGVLKVHDRDTLAEMSKFVRNKSSGKYEASWGQTDDLVSALYISNSIWHEVKDFYIPREADEKEEDVPWYDKIFDERDREQRENETEGLFWH